MKITLNKYRELGNLTNGIYKITNPSGNSYIGKFVIMDRFNSYVKIDRNCKEQPALYNSLKKHLVENHTLEILTHSQKEEHLSKYQMAYIRHFDTFNNGLNLTLGGDGNCKHTDEFCKEIWQLNKSGMNFQKIAKLHNLYPCSIQKLIKRTGNTPIKHKINMSQQQKDKISKANKGKLKIQIPTVALDENGVMQLVYHKAFTNKSKLSNWHNSCAQLYKRNYKNKARIEYLENKLELTKGE